MAGLFLKILNMSISAGWLVLAVVLIRLVIKRAPKWISCLLWAIVGLRLVMPFSLESVFSLIPSAQTISKPTDSPRPIFESGFTVIDTEVNGYLKSHYFEGVTREQGHFVNITAILGAVWLIGIIALLVYTVFSYLRLRARVSTAVLLRDTIYQSERVASPFVLGVISPKIYLPFDIAQPDVEHVIAHEQSHIRRKDHWWKPLGFLLLTVYWFNPLMWLGYILLCRDIEMACDESVVKHLNSQTKADYSQALLECSVSRRFVAACPIAFGEVGIRARVKSVLSYKKPTVWIVAVAIILSIICATCFLTNPAKKTNGGNNSSLEDPSTAVTSDISSEEEYLWGGTTSILYNSEVSSRTTSYALSSETDYSKPMIFPGYSNKYYSIGDTNTLGHFRNEFFGIGFSFDSSWKYLNNSERAKLNEGKTIHSDVVYCAKAEKDNGTTLVITLDYPSASNSSYSQYPVNFRHKTVQELLESGATNISYADTQQKFLRDECHIVYINYRYNGKLNKKAVAFIRMTEYFATISVNTVDGSDPNDVLSQFYPIKYNSIR